MKRMLITTLLAAAIVAPPMTVFATPTQTQSQTQTNKQQLREQKAKDKWEQAQVKYGKDSKQALNAKAKYDKVVAEDKGERKGERRAG